MSLTQALEKLVANSTRAKGNFYYFSQRVKIVDGDESAVHAQVTGTQLYDVILSTEKSDSRTVLKMWCDCGYFASGYQVCKHIWATLRTAELKRYLLGNGLPTQMQVDEDIAREFDGDEHYDGFENDDDLFDDGPARVRRNRVLKPKAPIVQKAAPPAWQAPLRELKSFAEKNAIRERQARSARDRQLYYIVDLSVSAGRKLLLIEMPYCERKVNGEWSKPKFQSIDDRVMESLADPEDRRIAALLKGVSSQYGYSSSYGTFSRIQIPERLFDVYLPWMSATGRLFLKRTPSAETFEPLVWDDGPPWTFRLDWRRDDKAKGYALSGGIVREGVRCALGSSECIVRDGLVFKDGKVARIDDREHEAWFSIFQSRSSILVADKDRDEFLKELGGLTQMPAIEFPHEFGIAEYREPPKRKVRLRAPKSEYASRGVDAEVLFIYGEHVLSAENSNSVTFSPELNQFTRRDIDVEQAAKERLEQLGFRIVREYYKARWTLPTKKLPAAVRQLTLEGWEVEAEGKLYRTGGEISIDVSTGIDWFDLNASISFGDQTVALPKLLQALKKGETMIALDDGSYGILPEDWLKKYGMFAAVGKAEGDAVRFRKAQVGLLDALLAAQPEASLDAAFRKARDEFRTFDGIVAVNPPASFIGELRGYQREGLGWLLFLESFGWGGCLADDMGLGKTVQVLALLAHRAEKRPADEPRPSLIVVPRSLIFNWKAEAAKFAPQLSILDHHNLDRSKDATAFPNHDIVLTTYGILRRDAALFADCPFDYCILDESQAIKNASTEQAKAVRLLNGNHRLAMSGTPVENHLGELWSLFEFLNPGMLGQASIFKLTGVGARNPEPETRELLAKALRPMILKRTKDQVAKDLPAKTEQTLYCDLEPEQKKLYDELRDYYRSSLMGKIATDGLNKSKIMVLEALLRLRQAACHPALIDKKHLPIGSAKLDVLLPQLKQVFEEGHKAIVFSQFTSFLSIVKKQLDADGIPYEYLDGKTRNRQACVDRFQNDPECKLFLISLKAGGMGLNLTAAEYVFLLDPWWNPAVEAQAIDRAHRIGQTRPVFAYRLIARGTVEEKVLELQKNKRELADAILNADNNLIGDLKKEDLELLLS